MARRLEVPVTLLHVVDVGHPDERKVFSGYMPSLRARAQEMLSRLETPELEVPASRREVLTGAAARCIVEKAAQMEAPWIMLPTRGHTRYRQLLLGSVTASVLHDAPCPVWTEAHTEYGSAHPDCKLIVCAPDLGPTTPKLLTTARQLSERLATPLRIVHSVPGIDPRFPSALADRAHAFLIDQAKDSFSVHCRAAGANFELEVVEDPILVRGIVDAVARLNADLLVIGRGVIQGPLGRLRTSAHDLIRRSPCAVLSV
jgi:nucleotide-binding universal stress UspA family protein